MEEKNIREQVLRKYGGHCAYCGKAITLKDLQVDHIHPKAEGGPDDIANYNPSCKACNVRKGTLSVEEFRHEVEACHGRMLTQYANYRQLVRYGQIQLVNDGKIEFYFESKESRKMNEFESSVREMCDRLAETLIKKNQDYGDSFAKSIDRYGYTAAFVRMDDKMNRVQNLTTGDKQKQVADESVEDTLLDLAGYAMLTAITYKSTHKEP